MAKRDGFPWLTALLVGGALLVAPPLLGAALAASRKSDEDMILDSEGFGTSAEENLGVKRPVPRVPTGRAKKKAKTKSTTAAPSKAFKLTQACVEQPASQSRLFSARRWVNPITNAVLAQLQTDGTVLVTKAAGGPKTVSLATWRSMCK